MISHINFRSKFDNIINHNLQKTHDNPGCHNSDQTHCYVPITHGVTICGQSLSDQTHCYVSITHGVTICGQTLSDQTQLWLYNSTAYRVIATVVEICN